MSIDDYGAVAVEPMHVVFVSEQELGAAAVGFNVPLRWLRESSHVHDPLHDRA